jgi:hypothetical protein
MTIKCSLCGWPEDASDWGHGALLELDLSNVNGNGVTRFICEYCRKAIRETEAKLRERAAGEEQTPSQQAWAMQVEMVRADNESRHQSAEECQAEAGRRIAELEAGLLATFGAGGIPPIPEDEE